MDATQILITVLAVIGIVIVGVLAIVPTMFDMSARSGRAKAHSRSHVDLAA
ncbi:hypothetical protein [Microlunatus speluncae]|uniref:hypothetical protein n=1 Tax=Microlunatus speluncae TaxID=2594267 RepID=UPI001375C8A9|nr:hypothetical protein [Microlunatus speluncae]